jgi:hypothetical protein
VVGALLHLYRLEEPSALTSPGRVDVLGSLPLVLNFSVYPRLTLHARVAPGLAGEGRQHVREDQILWERGAFRIEAGAAIQWRW